MNDNKNSNVTQNKFIHQQNLLNRQQNSHLTTTTSNKNTKALHVLANNHKNVVPGQRESINKKNQKSILTTPATPVSSKVLAATHQPSTSTKGTTKPAPTKQ